MPNLFGHFRAETLMPSAKGHQAYSPGPSPNLSQRERETFVKAQMERDKYVFSPRGFQKRKQPLSLRERRGEGDKRRFEKYPHLTSPKGRGISLFSFPKDFKKVNCPSPYGRGGGEGDERRFEKCPHLTSPIGRGICMQCLSHSFNSRWGG